jgi:uncharacterized protein YdaU (DUF1376 family)
MNYYSHHIGDFDKATRHLSRLERSVYRDLMDVYYDTEQPLTLDRPALCRRIIARSNEEATAVEQVLNEFFIETKAGWVHVRCEEELEKYRSSTSQKSAAGKASAAARALIKQQALNASSTGVKQTLNGKSTNQEPRTKTNNQKNTSSFSQFWAAYPLKVAKVAAEKAWTKLKVDDALLATILAAIEAQKLGHDWLNEDGAYIPHPASWLNAGRWLDEVRPYVERKPVDMWWATKESMMAKGLTLTPPVTPNSGEYPGAFKARIMQALEDQGKPERRAEPSTYVPPSPANGDDDLTSDQRKARMADMKRALKAASEQHLQPNEEK